MKYKKKYRGIPIDVKVWVISEDYGNHTATIREMTWEDAIAHEYDLSVIHFSKEAAENYFERYYKEAEWKKD